MNTPYLAHKRRIRRNENLNAALSVSVFLGLMALMGFYWASLGSWLVDQPQMGTGQIIFCFLAGLSLVALAAWAWQRALAVFYRRWRL